MLIDKNEKTFFGFWPADDNYCSLDLLILDDNGCPDKVTRSELRGTLLDDESDDWQIIICKDYMCLLHLKYLEEALNGERERNESSDISQISIGATRQIKYRYIEALNAFNFLIFSSCFTGRNHCFLHDFSEVTLWQCIRVMYSLENAPLRRIQFGRGTRKEMSRAGLCIEEKLSGFMKIEPNLFRDAIHYWDIVFQQGLVPLASVCAKIISEHRLENYNISVVLVWFEIENWIMDYTRSLRISTARINSNGRVIYSGIKDVIDLFPAGTTISNLASELHIVREIRNNIAHRGSMSSHDESVKAIKMLMQMFNIRSGLSLCVDFHRTPSTGM